MLYYTPATSTLPLTLSKSTSFNVLIDGTSPNGLSKQKIIHLTDITGQHGCFLRSEGNCLTYNFLCQNAYLYNIIILPYWSASKQCTNIKGNNSFIRIDGLSFEAFS